MRVIDLARGSMPVDAFPRWISIAKDIQYEQLQKPLLQACLERLLYIDNPKRARKPHEEQVRTLFRLIFGEGDTILIARTGFGKSLIFQAFTVLTNKITIQIVPLSKLGDEQFDRIKRLPNMKPCFINGVSKNRDRNLIKDVVACKYTHVLLGPEQAVSSEFQNALKSPQLSSQIGLVAIDELHLVKRWASFRPAFGQLKILRIILPQTVTWFGCTATLDSTTQQAVIKECGFRPLGRGDIERQTAVIRTSINRENIALSVQPIPYRQLSSYDRMYFLVDKAVDDIDEAVPERIPKTIIFLESKHGTGQLRDLFKHWLIAKTDEYSSARYTDDQRDDRLCVSNIVQHFHADIAEFDKNIRIAEFAKSDSKIRIMICTSILSVGYDIPDVERVVVWKLGNVESRNVDNLWQCIGRAARLAEIKAIAFLFFEYWAFDDQGRYPDKNTANEEALATQDATQSREVTPSDRGIGPATSIDTPSASPGRKRKPAEPKKPKLWSKDDNNHREKLTEEWKAIINGPCHRHPILQTLGEYTLIREAQVQSPLEWCCSKHSPQVKTVFTQAPGSSEILGPPAKNSSGLVALQYIDTWAHLENIRLFGGPLRQYSMSKDGGMDLCYRWELAHRFNEAGVFQDVDWTTLIWDELCQKCPSLTAWIDEFDEDLHDDLSRRLLAMLASTLVPVKAFIEEKKALLNEKRIRALEKSKMTKGTRNKMEQAQKVVEAARIRYIHQSSQPHQPSRLSIVETNAHNDSQDTELSRRMHERRLAEAISSQLVTTDKPSQASTIVASILSSSQDVRQSRPFEIFEDDTQTLGPSQNSAAKSASQGLPSPKRARRDPNQRVDIFGSSRDNSQSLNAEQGRGLRSKKPSARFQEWK